MNNFKYGDSIDFQREQPPRQPPQPPFPGGGGRPGPQPPQPPFPGGGRPGPQPPQPPFPGGGRPGPQPPSPPPFPGGGGRPGQGGPSGNAPRTAPPNRKPSRQVATFRVDAPSIRNCVGRFTYVWLSNGDEFWMFPIQVSRDTVTGFRWNRFFGWSFVGVSLHRIDAFTCV